MMRKAQTERQRENEKKSETKTMVRIMNFEHRSGKNCGSTSLWNISRFYGNPHEEHILFGLGSGIMFFYGPFGPASRSIGGRNPSLVEDFFENIGIPKRWESYPRFPKDRIKENIDSSIPVLVRTDLYYLPYYGKGRIHFPGHEIVIFGYDETEGEEKYIISDSSFEEPQLIKREDLSAAMNPPDSEPRFFPLENHILPAERFRFEISKEFVIRSLLKVCVRMTALENQFVGLKAIENFRDELSTWFEFEDSWWTFRFAYQVIERRGTGGGAFRYMFSDFLRDVLHLFSSGDVLILSSAAERFRDAANHWRELAFLFRDISDDLKIGKNVSIETRRRVRELANMIYQNESEAVNSLRKVL